MPRIWLTYAELGQHLGVAPDEARRSAVDAGLNRRRCRDGLSRVKLPTDGIDAFLLHYAAARNSDAPPETLDALTDALVARLQTVLAARDAAEQRHAV